MGNIQTPEWDGIDAFLYDQFSTGLPGDVKFYVEEAVRAGSPVLELGCGTGRADDTRRFSDVGRLQP